MPPGVVTAVPGLLLQRVANEATEVEMFSFGARVALTVAAFGVTLAGWSTADAAAPAYTLFESGQVRPLALSPDRKQLFAVNTPDGQLEVYDVKAYGLEHRVSIPVGVEPVAVAARSNEEVWVVNHLSDSVSIVRVGQYEDNRVIRTLLVGDEPRDIVFAGPQKKRAFITAAHRGQNNPNNPQLTTAGVGRADVWVFDSTNLGSTLGGTPLKVLSLFSDTPRALAATPDGSKVYAAAYFSGNRTTTIHPFFVDADGGSPAPNTNHAEVPQPSTGLIVRFNGQHWVDELGREWDDHVKFDLPDKDVFVIDANATIPAQLSGASGYFSGVGTILSSMVVNPVSKKVYVANTEARNEERFSGPGVFAGHSLRGHNVENRITVLDPQTHGVAPRHINPHVDYADCCASLPNEENELSLALPQGMAISADGDTLYVAALGSDKIGVFDTHTLEQDMYWPDPAEQLDVSGGGPTAVLLDESRNRLYVLTRFDNAISAINTSTGDEVQHLAMFNPEPASVTEGRRFLYDARLTSSHGDQACASCHVSGDMDHLAWDLGNPDADPMTAPGPFRSFFGDDFSINPLKGPMITQSLRGLANHGPMHWRGDRTGGFNGPSAQPNSGSFDEVAAFKQFNEAFDSLLGRSEPLSEGDMDAFAAFALQLTYPPNPIRALDNSLTPDQAAGRDMFFNKPATMGAECNFCHHLDPHGNAEFGVARPGFFGTDGSSVASEAFGQTLKIPHLRNLYQKVGKFGLEGDPVINPDPMLSQGHTGPQIRGFGVTHDGSLDTVMRFISEMGFVVDPTNPDGFGFDAQGFQERRQVEAFILAFDSDMAPIVGQQITLRSDNATTANPRINLLIARAAAGECDLVVRGIDASDRMAGYLYQNGVFKRDEAGKPALTDTLLRKLAKNSGGELTYTCTPPGSGVRVGLDRDLDGTLNGDEDDGGC